MNLNIDVFKKIFFGLSLLFSVVYIQLAINPALFYHYQQIAFLFDCYYFESFVSYPGGMVEYVTNFFAQFFRWSWMGTLIIMGFVGGIAYFMHRIISFTNPANPAKLLVWCLPFPLIIMLLSNYRFPFVVVLQLLLIVVFSFGFIVLSKKLEKYLIPLFLLFATVLYYLAGGGALLVFLLISVVYVFTLKISVLNKVTGILSFVLTYLVICFVSYKYLFLIAPYPAFFHILPQAPVMLNYRPEVIFYAIYGYFPFLYLGLGMVRVKNKKIEKPQPKKSKKKETRKNYIPLVKCMAECFIILIIFVVGLTTTYNQNAKKKLQIDYQADNQNWNAVISLAETLGYIDYDFYCNFHTNRALYHTGQLSERLFDFPQLLGSAALLMDAPVAGEVAIPSSDLYFDLGFINESQHWAYEAQTLIPYSPKMLKRLAIINIINRDYLVAQKYLTILNKNILERGWVQKYQAYLNDTTLIANDEMVQEKRGLIPTKNFIADSPKDKILNLLSQNTHNKMAYEYLQANYLMQHDLGNFMKNLELLKNFNYKKMPGVYEQAALIYSVRADSSAIAPPFPISNETKNDFGSFNQTMYRYKGNMQQGRSELSLSNRKTYWYYILFDSPLVTKSQIKTR